jgi:hypothetical protein
MRYRQKAWQDTKESLGGAPTVISLVVFPLIGMALHLLLEGPEAMSSEAYVWAVYALAPLGLAFVLLFLWNLVCAPYRTERERADELAASLAALTESTGFDATPEYVATREMFTLTESACLLARIPLRATVEQGAAIGYLRILKEQVARKELEAFSGSAQQTMALNMAGLSGAEGVPDAVSIMRESLSRISREQGLNIEGLEP